MTEADRNKAKDIEKLILMCGGRYEEWYVGVTDDVVKRVFGEHGVSEKPGKNSFVTRRMSSHEVAREVAKLYMDRGCKGQVGPLGDDRDMVYAYRMTSNTNP
jgi:hypothetical protein